MNDVEKKVDEYIRETMPFTAEMDNGLLKTQLCNFVEWTKI